MPFTEVLRLMPSQFEHLYAMVGRCVAGQVGSEVLITQCPFAPEQPSLVYLKMFPLTSNSDATITHYLGATYLLFPHYFNTYFNARFLTILCYTYAILCISVIILTLRYSHGPTLNSNGKESTRSIM